MTAPTDPARLDTLQGALHSRKSTFHLAHASVSLLVAMIAASTAAKLFWDYELGELALFGAAVIIALVMFTHAFVRWALGRRALAKELVLFAELKDLRRTLGLDDPSVLLPR